MNTISPPLTKSLALSDPPSLVEVGKYALTPRVYLSSFPKAGTHLAETFLRQIAAPWTERPWAGTFKDNAWSTQWVDLSRFDTITAEWPAGAYLKGHGGHHPHIAQKLWEAAVSVIFVHRNLRDVAVSAAFHVLNEDKDKLGRDTHRHPGKDLYRALPTFEHVLLAIIEGIGEWPGLADRWALYRGWFDEKWTLPMRYEDMLHRPHEAASRMLRYVTGQTAAFWGAHMTIDKADHDATVDRMVSASTTQKLVTFRRGISGEWREHWTDRLEAAFVATGAKAANEAIGYE